MDSLGNLILTELIPNKFFVVGSNTFLFCVELLSYPKFLNNGLTFKVANPHRLIVRLTDFTLFSQFLDGRDISHDFISSLTITD